MKDIDTLRLNFEREKAVLQNKEALWQRRWESRKNPFVAVSDWTSNRFRAVRSRYIGKYLSAQQELAIAKKKKDQ